MVGRPSRRRELKHVSLRLECYIVHTHRDKERCLPKEIPVVTPDVDSLRNPPSDEPLLTWLGHAAFLLQYCGVNVLADPICSERCSPVQFAGPRRFTASALQVAELPHIDVVIISCALLLISALIL